MSLDIEPSGFSGALLAAMPAVRDPAFGRSVVLICAHSSDGAMGLIVNSPLPEDLPDTLPADLGPYLVRKGTIYRGGPAETRRPFVLHSPDWQDGAETLSVTRDLAVTASSAALSAVASDQGPNAALVTLGYAAWGPGQLESEVLANFWLSGFAEPEIVFGQEADKKWPAAVAALGAAPEALSGQPGRA